MNRVVLVVGMSRSGTSLAVELLARSDHAHVEVEPHMLWKAGRFATLADEAPPPDATAVAHIRRTLLGWAAGRVLVEKSPPNCLRPDVVHAVFPEATIVYLQRDPIPCVRSNVLKSQARQSLDPRIVLRKYVLVDRGRRASLDEQIDAHATRSLREQVRPRDALGFGSYATRLLWLKGAHGIAPFGPKIDGFARVVRERGIVAYHARALVAANRLLGRYEQLYGDRLHRFALEQLRADPSEVERLHEAAGCPVDPTSWREAMSRRSQDPFARAPAPELDRAIADAIADAEREA